MENYTKKQIDQNFLTLFLLYSAYFVGMGTLAPNISNIVPNLEGATESLLAAMVAYQLIIAIISILFFGYYSDRLSDKFSRKTILIASNFLAFSGFFIMGLAPNFMIFEIGYFIAASGSGAFLPIGFAIIGDSFPPEERGNKFGVMQFGLIIGAGGGLIFGGIIGGLDYVVGWRYAYGLAAIMIFGAIYLYHRYGINIVKGQSDPELSDFKGEITYDYKITFSNLKQILRKKSVVAILISVMFINVSATTMGVWGVYFLETKVPNTLMASIIYMLAGLGGLPGTIVGGNIGDSLSKKGKKNGRAIIGLFGAFIGILLGIVFYLLIPFDSGTFGTYILSFFIFVIIGFISGLFLAFRIGNIYAIYSECCVPENRSIANAMNGLMASLGGVIGNLLVSLIIAVDITLLPVAIWILFLISLIGAFFWIIPYFYYVKESQNLRETMTLRREELDKTLKT